MIKRRTLITSLVLTGLTLAAPVRAQQARTANLDIAGAFSRATAKSARAGIAFVTISSKGDADRLMGFRTPVCNRPELHTHINEDGVMRMRQVEAIDVPAGGDTELKSGGLHLMLIDLTRQLVEGETFDVTLEFETAGDVVVTVPIKGPFAMN